MADRYDYVIVGAGSAGSILANKLSAQPGTSVLLLEAGPKDRAKEIRIPAAFSKLFDSKFDWGYRTAPQRGLNGRELYFPRGKTLGGSSAMNAQMHIPGHPSDFDAWPAGWDWDTMKPYLEVFEKESCSVSDARDPNPATRAFLDAVQAADVCERSDLTPERLEGAGLVRVHQRKGLRCTAADAWLKPAKGRDNLRIATDSHAVAIEFDGNRAIGVRFQKGGETIEVGAEREVILCGGAIGSPHLLMLSGVGPEEELREHGIEVVEDVPGVGRNLRDHVMAIALWDAKISSLFDAEKPAQLLRLLLRRRGLLTSNVGEAAAFVRTREDLEAPDLELIFAPVLYLEEGLTAPTSHGFSIASVCLQPQSAGSLTLASSDPFAAPVIDPGFLTDGEDARVLVAGTKLARKIASTKPLADLVEGESAPGPDVQDDAAIEEWVRAAAHTIYHPIGTCAVGSVVDDELRVNGLEGLRVVDASVIPNLMRGHSHAQVSMLALRAAEMIRRAPLREPSSA